MDGFPGRQNDSFNNNIIQPIDGDQSLALSQSLVS